VSIFENSNYFAFVAVNCHVHSICQVLYFLDHWFSISRTVHDGEYIICNISSGTEHLSVCYILLILRCCFLKSVE
jgi:hypothetical protein